MIIILTGAALNGKRFTFCQDEYILRTSCIRRWYIMENSVKGKEYGDRNDHWNCGYCSDDHQYYRHIDQYSTILWETKTSKK